MQQLTWLAVTRRAATSVIFLAIALAGVIAYIGLPINQFPEVTFRVVTIVTIYPGANPKEIETQISRPIEDAVASLPNVDFTSSSSSDGFSTVVVRFKDAADAAFISTDVERRVSTVASGFPSGVNRPIVQKIDLAQAPVMRLAVVDAELAPEVLYERVRTEVLPVLEGVTGVSQVEIVGGRKPEIHVAVDPERLAAYRITLSQVQQALAGGNASLPGGSVTRGEQLLELQVNALLQRPEDVGEIVVAGSAGRPVRVRDLATVREEPAALTQLARVNGEQALLIALAKASGANLTDVTDEVRAHIPAIEARLPASSHLVVVSDETPFVRRSLDGIQQELLIAILLTSVVLLVFLHNPRAAGIVLLSIPTTLLSTFIVMQWLGFSLNFLSTLGLTLTIGILVDDSIVVLENILRHLDRGEEPQEAALNGRAEIGLAAVAITLVDVAVFAPTGLVSGQIGGFFREFGFTVAAATLASLVVSFTLTPLLASMALRGESAGAAGRGWWRRFGVWWDADFARWEQRYRRVLIWSLRFRWVVVAGSAATTIAGVGLITSGVVPTEFIPASDIGFFNVRTEAPPSTTLAAHDTAMREVEATLLAMPDIVRVTSSIGVSSSGVLGSGNTGQARFGSVFVETLPLSSGRRRISAITDEARERLSAITGVATNVSLQEGGPQNGQRPVAVRLTGPELTTLSALAEGVKSALDQIPGLADVENGAPVGQPQLRIDVDHARAAELGVSPAAVGLTVRTAFTGVVATKFQRPDGTLQDVRLQLSASAREAGQSVEQLPLPTLSGGTVPLRQVATVTTVAGPTSIQRRDRERVISVGADLAPGVTLGEVQPALVRMVEEMTLPSGYTAALGGNAEQSLSGFADLLTALGASVILSYLLMAILYNSFTHPLVILFSLPAAVGGAIFGLLIFGYSFSIFSMIGLILLVGLAIKNGILLVDRTNRNREHGMEIHEALLEAGPARLRAILMTSVTIAFALLPVALHFGEGAETRAPLAATVLGGVVSSTLLTLVLVPVMYTTLDGLAARTLGRVLPLVRWYFGIGAGRSREAAVQRLGAPLEPEAPTMNRPR